MIISIASGKGETGNTFLTFSLSALFKNSCFADCNLDSPNLYLLLNSKIKKKFFFCRREERCDMSLFDIEGRCKK